MEKKAENQVLHFRGACPAYYMYSAHGSVSQTSHGIIHHFLVDELEKHSVLRLGFEQAVHYAGLINELNFSLEEGLWYYEMCKTFPSDLRETPKACLPNK
jgi:hypothetical protein